MDYQMQLLPPRGNHLKPQGGSKQLMSFSNYVKSELNNNIDEITACKKYKQFLADLTLSKVCRFFEANKDREWFRLKYHPIENEKISRREALNILERLKIFNLLNDANKFDSLPFDVDHAQEILTLMNAIIACLESESTNPIDILIRQQSSDLSDINKLFSDYIPKKSNSVVIDNINIDVTNSQIQEICLKANPDLIRLTPLDPHYVAGGQLKRKFVAIYKHHVDIRDVCWHLTRMKLNNEPLNVSINKFLDERIMTVPAITNHPNCVLNDIRKAIILILNFDEYRGLQGKRKQLIEDLKPKGDQPSSSAVKMEVDEIGNGKHNGGQEPDDVAPLSPPRSEKSANEDEEDKSFDIQSLDEEREKERRKLFEFKFNTDLSPYRLASKLAKSKNSVLDYAFFYLVDYVEASQARYYLNGVHPRLIVEELGPDTDAFLEDKFAVIDQAIQNLNFTHEENRKLLDKMLWYLRIVHSFDFYNMNQYKQEDELSIRMSVIHLRQSPTNLVEDFKLVREYMTDIDRKYNQFGFSQTQKYVTKDEERFNYRSYGKVITDELRSYAQKIQKNPDSSHSEDAFKCKHCTRVFQKLTDIARHFVSKHRWAIDSIELETDFFNAYLFDINKIDPCPPKDLLERKPNKFFKTMNTSQMGEDPDLLEKTIDEYKKMDSFVWEAAPRAQKESDPRNEAVVDYTDISFDDAI